jgi:hypothetical protein
VFVFVFVTGGVEETNSDVNGAEVVFILLERHQRSLFLFFFSK